MSRIVVGRIFWKELRTQRSLWIGVTCLVIGIQTLITMITLYYRHQSHSLEEFYGGLFFSAYLGATLYAIASGAASFSEETEGNTAVLLRTMPMTRSDAFAGKWGYGLASTGVLFLVLAVAAGMCAGIASLGFQGGGAFSRDLPLGHMLSAAELSRLFTVLWIGLLIPITFFAFCALYSLLLSEGVIAALCGTFSTIFALALAVRFGDFTGLPLRLSLLAGALVATDFWLTGVWLGRGISVQWRWTAKRAGDLTGQWTWLTRRVPGPIQLLRVGEPVVPWKRALQRLVWKECRQAWPYVGISALAATVMVFASMIVPESRFFGIVSPWIIGLATPLVMGVGAYHVDQKGRAYRFLADRGLTPDGSWIVKHVVWIGLTFATCGYVLAIDQMGWRMNRDKTFGFQESILYTIGASVARPAIDSAPQHPPNLTAFGVVALYIMLAYSIGQRSSFALPKGLLAFGLAMGATVFVCMTWTIFVARGVPLGWTIGAIPPVLLAYTWTHTQRWHTQQLYSYRWYWVVAWMGLPLAGIVAAAILYWPQIGAHSFG